MKTLSIKVPPAVSDFFDELLLPDNAFSSDGKPYIKRRLIGGALAFWILTILEGQINEEQWQAYKEMKYGNEVIFKLAVAYCRAKRGVKGYRIDQKGNVYVPNLFLQQKVVKK